MRAVPFRGGPAVPGRPGTPAFQIPPKVRESLFRALGTLSGVTVSKQPVEDAAGRPALAVYEARHRPVTTCARSC